MLCFFFLSTSKFRAVIKNAKHLFVKASQQFSYVNIEIDVTMLEEVVVTVDWNVGKKNSKTSVLVCSGYI